MRTVRTGFRRIIAMVCALALCMCLLPLQAHALTNEEFKIYVHIGYANGSSFTDVAFKTITLNCMDTTDHSGYNHTTELQNFTLDKLGWSEYAAQVDHWEYESYGFMILMTALLATQSTLGDMIHCLSITTLSEVHPIRPTILSGGF